MLARKLTKALAVTALAFTGLAGTQALAKTDSTVLSGFTLIDGTGAAPKPDQAVVLTNGRISWVGPSAKVRVPRGAERVDLKGKYVMPGLIDLHVHLALVKDMKADQANYTRESVEQDLRNYASYGVTTVQAMGTDKDLIFPLRAEQRAGRPTMARVFTAGQGIVFKGGYGGTPGITNPVATVEDARREVAAQAAKGADLIKFWFDDELSTMPRMPDAMAAAIIDEAHKHKLRAVAHIFYLADAKTLARMGVDGFAHSVRDQPVDQELIDLMKSRGIWQIAETLSREASMFAYGERAPFLDDPFFQRGISRETLAILGDPARMQSQAANPHFHDFPKFLATAEANLKTLADAGVRIGFGTDSGPTGRFGGYFVHWELALMVKSGVTPMQAIRAATRDAAEVLGDKNIGTVQRGKWADLLVLDADPVANIENTRRIDAVYIAGNKVSSTK